MRTAAELRQELDKAWQEYEARPQAGEYHHILDIQDIIRIGNQAREKIEKVAGEFSMAKIREAIEEAKPR